MTTELDIAERLLAAAKRAGAEAADVLVIAGESISIGVADGALEEVESAETREAGLRVLIGQRQACVSSSDLAPEALVAMAERAVAIARETPEDPYCGLPEAEATGGHAAPETLDLTDAQPLLRPEALEEIARAAEAAALGVDGVTQVEQAYAAREASQVTLAATNGFSGGYRRTDTSIGVSAIAGSGLGRERDYAHETRCHRADLPTPDWIGQRAGRRAVERLDPKRPPGGAVPVLYHERVAASLISHILVAVNGASVSRGASWLMDAMETQVLPEGLDIVEDPLIPRGLSSRPFDGEGIAARRRPIVENGRLVRWVLDSATARKLGLSTTGNARRGLSSPPSPGSTNVRLTQGPRSRDDLIREMGTGLLVTSMIGASINPTTGDYSRGASGFWIEGGEIAYPVNEITIAGKLPEMVRTILPADDADPYRSQSVPSLLVEGLTVGA